MKDWNRTRKRNRHHIRAKAIGGTNKPRNIIYLDEERHKAWHFLFGNKNFVEVAEMLLRAVAMKQDYYNRKEESYEATKIKKAI